MIPYGRQTISDEDIDAVVDVLRSDWLTTGPKVEEFEAVLAAFSGAQNAVTFSSGTAALHAAMHILDIGPGDEVIVSPLTFAASANCVLHMGGTPVFADVCPDTLLIDPQAIKKKITANTKALIAVDYAGQPCRYQELNTICGEYGLTLVADACHSLGAQESGVPVGRLASVTALSFHPVKNITTGEGGALLLNDAELADKARIFRNHGISTDHRQRAQAGRWDYDMQSLGFNYRLTDIQCALGISQLKRLPAWITRREQIASRYDALLEALPGVIPIKRREEVVHANHLYVVRIDPERAGITRDEAFARLREKGICVNVHYKPIFRHSYYADGFELDDSDFPSTLTAADQILSLPIYPAMTDEDVDRVVAGLQDILQV